MSFASHVVEWSGEDVKRFTQWHHLPSFFGNRMAQSGHTAWMSFEVRQVVQGLLSFEPYGQFFLTRHFSLLGEQEHIFIEKKIVGLHGHGRISVFMRIESK